MKFARVVFLGAGIWGIAILPPLYFLFDTIGSQHASPITYPQFYYGFTGVAMAWQFAFIVIGWDPIRFRLMMIPSMAEKLIYGLTMGILYGQGRMTFAELLPVFPDLLICALFAVAFAKTSESSVRRATLSRFVSVPN